MAIFLGTLMLGGAGDGYPLIGAVVQFAQLILLAVVSYDGSGNSRSGPLTRCGLVLSCAAIALPLLHLVPLPDHFWPATSGRRIVDGVRTVINAPQQWHPLTLDPGYTLDTGLELLPALATFLVAARLDQRRQVAMIALVVLVAGVSAGLGVFQKSAGLVELYAGGHSTNGPGLFVNRNHQATLMLIAIVLTPVTVCGLAWTRGYAGRVALTAGLVLLFAGGVIATTSRAGLILVLPAVATAAILTPGVRVRLVPLLAGGGVLVVGLWLALRVASVQLVIARFAQLDERPLYWQDSLAAIRAFWPLGSGIGTFTRVFPMYERDTLVSGASINAAHNEYVQLLMEGGLPAALLIGAGLLLLIRAMMRLGRADARDRRLAWSAVAAILIILLHSIVDYPLRMMSMMAIFGLLAAVLLGVADRRPSRSDAGEE